MSKKGLIFFEFFIGFKDYIYDNNEYYKNY